MQAALASLLERDLHQVPDFVNMEPVNDWYLRLVQWLLPQGLYPVYHTPLDPCNVIIPGYCILGVVNDPPNVDHPDWIHAVVGKARWDGMSTRFDVVHDPNPTPKAIVEIKDVLWIVRDNAGGHPIEQPL